MPGGALSENVMRSSTHESGTLAPDVWPTLRHSSISVR